MAGAGGVDCQPVCSCASRARWRRQGGLFAHIGGFITGMVCVPFFIRKDVKLFGAATAQRLVGDTLELDELKSERVVIGNQVSRLASGVTRHGTANGVALFGVIIYATPKPCSRTCVINASAA